jgi:hypothetical protein
MGFVNTLTTHVLISSINTSEQRAAHLSKPSSSRNVRLHAYHDQAHSDTVPSPWRWEPLERPLFIAWSLHKRAYSHPGHWSRKDQSCLKLVTSTGRIICQINAVKRAIRVLRSPVPYDHENVRSLAQRRLGIAIRQNLHNMPICFFHCPQLSPYQNPICSIMRLSTPLHT